MSQNEKEKIDHQQWEVVITDCDHGSVAIEKEEFDRIGAKKPFVINVARGPIIEEKELIQALNGGQISGAGLDVLEKEPPDPDNPLLKMENVILSPHVAFYFEESIRELKRRAAEGVSAVLAGKWPKVVVNKEVIGRTRASIAGTFPG